MEPVIATDACVFEDVCPFPQTCCPFKCRCEQARFTYLYDGVHLPLEDPDVLVIEPDQDVFTVLLGDLPDSGVDDGTRDDAVDTGPRRDEARRRRRAAQRGRDDAQARRARRKAAYDKARAGEAPTPRGPFAVDPGTSPACTFCDDADEPYCALCRRD